MRICVLVAAFVGGLVSGMTPLSAHAADADTKTEQSSEAPEIERIILKNGQVFRGTVVERTSTHLVVDLLGSGQMTLRLDKIESVELDQTVEITEDGQLFKRDPNRTRYLYSPSAMGLKAGEGYFSQKELFFSSVAYGITDNISVLVGSIIPLLLSGDGQFNFITAIKISDTLVEDSFHIAGGFEAFSFEDGGELVSAGFLFGSATLGSHRSHVTLSMGKPFSLSEDSRDLGPLIVTLSGNVRVSRSVALVSENWFLAPESDVYDDEGALIGADRDFLNINAIAARIMGENIATDIGLIWVEGEGPLPWLDVTYNWF